MANSFIICDFGTDEEAAQQARHKLDGWTQAFHLGKKIEYKFERTSGGADEASAEKPAAESKPKSKSKTKAAKESTGKEKGSGAAEQIRMIIRLSFSDHEKLSAQRWVERIPSEDPFKASSPEIVRSGEPSYVATSTLFDSLD